MRLIKRYGNRRLYDTESSSTITQMDLSQMVKAGMEVKIVEASSGKDITLAVLGRLAISEASQWKDGHYSKELFRTIITTGGEKSMSILKNTILASIGALQVTKDKAEKIIDDLIKKGELDKSEKKKAVMELLAKADKSTAEWRKKFSSEATKVGKDVSAFAKKMQPALQEDLKKLEAKVDKMSKQLKNIEAALNK